MVRFISDSRKAPVESNAPLLLIGAGVPRAATSSMQAAFEQLGFNPCLHMAEIIPHASREQIMLDALREKDKERRQKLLLQLVRGYESICDLPVVFFTPDLMDMFPDVKIVLNGRPSSEAWAVSAFDSLGFFFTTWFKWTGLLWKTDRLWYALNMECFKWVKEHFDIDEVFTPKLYDAYYDHVRAEVRKRGKEVLEFKAEDGWEPLCKFLGKEIPDGPFPRLNEKKTFAIVKWIIITRGLLAWAALFFTIWVIWRVGVPLMLSVE
ncbi:hypothetical protein EDB81DRAFT_687801 [Dactylonectria macrodidyma]|uniref:Nad dependent epimerase dehydratase n=1 Tax=Dactylonectria macrodidyma TaxID=307937 RepID=A0A9P9JC99_9HYPO|nr:hypothetical protein EDB81DRAFT_687801 [Dactylonectria macrodidyma]